MEIVFCVLCFVFRVSLCVMTQHGTLYASQLYTRSRSSKATQPPSQCVCFLSHPETCGRFLAVQKDLRVP